MASDSTNSQKLDALSLEDRRAMAAAEESGRHAEIARLRAKAGIDDSVIEVRGKRCCGWRKQLS
jgi:hypothetical protein